MDPQIDESGKEKIIHVAITPSKQKVIARMDVLAAHSRC
jgi:hypothetical protein